MWQRFLEIQFRTFKRFRLCKVGKKLNYQCSIWFFKTNVKLGTTKWNDAAKLFQSNSIETWCSFLLHKWMHCFSTRISRLTILIDAFVKIIVFNVIYCFTVWTGRAVNNFSVAEVVNATGAPMHYTVLKAMQFQIFCCFDR